MITNIEIVDAPTEFHTDADDPRPPSEIYSEAAAADPNLPLKDDYISRWPRVMAFGVLPAASVILAAGVGFLAYQDRSAASADRARSESVQAATDSTVALLSYQADTAETTLNDARDRLTGPFRDSYSSLIHDVVIPGAKQKQISSVATVPAAASLSATDRHATVLVYVDQSIIVGSDPPTASASCVKVTLESVNNHWLISQFDPI